MLRESVVLFSQLFGEIWFRSAFENSLHDLESLCAVTVEDSDRGKLINYGEEVV